ncbi:MAG: fibrobacter succinogenes major paralogous domain-containing protein [Bacteroidales bacterium]|jgi:uncharacterized protein (TIGR02145 family)|nr:fibrobacter succinogenes major paralogous domain-containing protein [Bacteroidales bacterium]
MNTKILLTQFEQALKDNNAELIEKISALLECKQTPQFNTVEILNREHKTIIIGKQEWTAQNLFCPKLGFHYKNNPKNSEGGYGTLHTHYNIPSIQELLTDGWRVATDGDWQQLIDFVGDNAGKKLKSKDGWMDDGNGTDEFGFNALPAGSRDTDGSYSNDRGDYTYFWSSSAYSSAYAWTRYFTYSMATVGRGYTNRSNGFSVRCVRDIMN